jgi:hypothetical protein
MMRSIFPASQLRSDFYLNASPSWKEILGYRAGAPLVVLRSFLCGKFVRSRMIEMRRERFTSQFLAPILPTQSAIAEK